MLGTLLAASPSAWAFRNGDRVRTSADIDHPTYGIVNAIKHLRRSVESGCGVGALVKNFIPECRLDIILSTGDGSSIKESRSKHCGLGMLPGHEPEQRSLEEV